MQDSNKEQFMEAMNFIVDAVSQSTTGEKTAEVGLYLACLVIADHKRVLPQQKMDQLKALMERAEAVRAMVE